MSLRTALESALPIAQVFYKSANWDKTCEFLESTVTQYENELVPHEKAQFNSYRSLRMSYPSDSADDLVKFSQRVIKRLKEAELAPLPNTSSSSLGRSALKNGDSDSSSASTPALSDLSSLRLGGPPGGAATMTLSGIANILSSSAPSSARSSLSTSSSTGSMSASTSAFSVSAQPAAPAKQISLYDKIYPKTQQSYLYDNVARSLHECKMEESCAHLETLVKSCKSTGQVVAWERILILLCGNVEPYCRKMFLEKIQTLGKISVAGFHQAFGALLHHHGLGLFTRLLAHEVLAVCQNPSEMMEYFNDEDMQCSINIMLDDHPKIASAVRTAITQAWEFTRAKKKDSASSSASPSSSAAAPRKMSAVSSAILAPTSGKSRPLFSLIASADDDYVKINEALMKGNQIRANALITGLISNKKIDWAKILIIFSQTEIDLIHVIAILDDSPIFFPVEDFKEAIRFLSKQAGRQNEFSRLVDKTFLSSCTSPAAVLAVCETPEVANAIMKMGPEVVLKIGNLIKDHPLEEVQQSAPVSASAPSVDPSKDIVISIKDASAPESKEDDWGDVSEW